MNFKVVAVFLSLAVASSQACLANLVNQNYQNCYPYIGNPANYAAPNCPTLLANAIPITDLGTLYAYYGTHFNPIMSRYYAARQADAFNYPDNCPCANATELAELDVVTPWSGIYGGIAIDGAKGYDRSFIRRCTFPTSTYPFLCQGDQGQGWANGGELGYLSYIPVLKDANNTPPKWTLFTHCWNPPRPGCPNCVPGATSFNVFSVDPTISTTDRGLIIAKLSALGFSTASSNIIEPDFSNPTI